MRLLIRLAIMAAFLTAAAGIALRANRQSSNESTKPVATSAGEETARCISEQEIRKVLGQLASSDQTAEQQNIAARLRDYASQSTECRNQIVMVLISMLQRTDPDLVLNRPSFFLWHYGSKLLSDLKAVEAMDLLIANFELHDGTPFPFDHHPALGAAIDLGNEAIPALKSVLEKNDNDSSRRYAVFCLALIGGPIVKQVLRNRLSSEVNCCVRNCIHASLEAFDNKILPNHITSENRTNWYATFMCDCDPALRITITSVK